MADDFMSRHWAAVDRKYDILAEQARAATTHAQTEASTLPGLRAAQEFYYRGSGQHALESAQTEAARRYMPPEWRGLGYDALTQKDMTPVMPGGGAPGATPAAPGAPGATPGAPGTPAQLTPPPAWFSPSGTPAAKKMSFDATAAPSAQSLALVGTDDDQEGGGPYTPLGAYTPSLAEQQPTTDQINKNLAARGKTPFPTAPLPSFTRPRTVSLRRGTANVKPRGYAKGDEDISRRLSLMTGDEEPLNVPRGAVTTSGVGGAGAKSPGSNIGNIPLIDPGGFTGGHTGSVLRGPNIDLGRGGGFQAPPQTRFGPYNQTLDQILRDPSTISEAGYVGGPGPPPGTYGGGGVTLPPGAYTRDDTAVLQAQAANRPPSVATGGDYGRNILGDFRTNQNIVAPQRSDIGALRGEDYYPQPGGGGPLVAPGVQAERQADGSTAFYPPDTGRRYMTVVPDRPGGPVSSLWSVGGGGTPTPAPAPAGGASAGSAPSNIMTPASSPTTPSAPPAPPAPSPESITSTYRKGIADVKGKKPQGLKKGSADVKGKGGGKPSKGGGGSSDQPGGLEGLLAALAAAQGGGAGGPQAGPAMPPRMAPGAAAPPGFAQGVSEISPPAVPPLMPMTMPRLPDTGFARGTPSVEENPGYPVGAGYLFGRTAVPGQGSGTVDTVPAVLAPHEAVLNRAAADMLGRGVIASLNARGARQMGMPR